MEELRSMAIFADGVQVAQEHRMHLRGRSTMSLRPDLWELQIHNASSRALAAIYDAEELLVEGEEMSAVCRGRIEEIYPHTEDGKDITTVIISDGAAFWDATVSLSLAKNNSVHDAIRAVASRCTRPVPVHKIQAKNVVLPRGQVFHGRAADCIASLAKSVSARAFFVRGSLHVMGKCSSSETISLHREDLLSNVMEANGAYIARLASLKGYSIGQTVYFPDYSAAKYRLLCQSVDADNYEGVWKTELIMVDESKILTGDDWGGG